jgi:NAD(P)-dependent dehydrogenase (short-subunit alcohol dehydrogenase family)
MDLGLEGRRALVFGSTAGLGRATAETLAAEGALVAVSGRRADVAAELAASLPGAVAVVGDITVAGEPARMVDEAAAGLGGLDVCVVNTSGGTPGGMTEVSADDEAAAYERMLLPALAATRAAIPHLRAGGDGRLLYITARSVVEASPELALSGVFRSGVAAAARSLALELAPDVLVNVVVPGQFDTGALARAQAARAAADGTTLDAVRDRHRAFIPMGRFGHASELADVITFLCSARASFVTGSVVRVDGGAVIGY